MESVYLETTIISYLVARPSRDLVLAAHQSITRDWWENEQRKYHCVVSDEVMREIAGGNPSMARLRIQMIEHITVLNVNREALRLADTFLKTGALPQNVRTDAIHLAVAVNNKLDYLITWNCRHIANGQILRRLSRETERMGLKMPIVCTPLELIGGDADVYK